MKLLNRKQFRQHWNQILPGLGDESSGLWALEKYRGVRCRWFIQTRPVDLWTNEAAKTEFQLWCHHQCRGLVLCYSINEHEDWWGFTHKGDIAWWTLKWAS